MALDKRIREKINSIMEDNPNISREELIEIVKEYAPKPDTCKLIEQEYKRIAQRIISSYKDEHCYVNVSRTTSKEVLQKVRAQLSKKYRGLNKSLRKIDTREQVLNGQMEIDQVLRNVN